MVHGLRDQLRSGHQGLWDQDSRPWSVLVIPASSVWEMVLDGLILEGHEVRQAKAGGQFYSLDQPRVRELKGIGADGLLEKKVGFLPTRPIA